MTEFRAYPDSFALIPDMAQNKIMIRPRIKRIKLPSKGKVDHYFIASDWHTDALNIPTWKILQSHSQDIPKRHRKLIINGDFLDCEHLMGKGSDMKRWAKRVPIIETLIAQSEYEAEWGNEILDQAQKIFSEVIMIMGNHDYRYELWADSYCPKEYAHNFNFSSMLNLKKRGIECIQYPDYLDIGNLTITHGYKHGRNHNKQMMEVIGRSCLYGHVHHFNCMSFDVRGESKRATSQPCMSNLAPEYQRKRGENNWSNGYMQLAMRSSGSFNLYCFETWNDQLVLPSGRVIHG